jgi:hypothetical protein
MIGLLLGEFSKFVNKYDDDIIDRCNHRYTVIVLSTFITIIATKQYFGDPIVSFKSEKERKLTKFNYLDLLGTCAIYRLSYFICKYNLLDSWYLSSRN